MNNNRYPGSITTRDGGPFAGSGIVKWCAKCGVHRAQEGGRLINFMGGRHWVCAEHAGGKKDGK